MQKTTYIISKMDCPSEENLIRLKLNEIASVKMLNFDIPKRRLVIFHENDLKKIDQAIRSLNFGEKILTSEETNQTFFNEDHNQKKLLWKVLIINFILFIIEMSTGFISKSMSLVADSLDMLADSLVYGISLFAIGGSVLKKKKIAKIAGYFQIILAILGFVEVLKKFLGVEELPNFSTMIIVSVLALIANGYSLYLMQQSKSKEEAHIQASLIFTSNDVIINLGVIIAGLLVYWLKTGIPDLIVGTVVFIIVLKGAFTLLKISK